MKDLICLAAFAATGGALTAATGSPIAGLIITVILAVVATFTLAFARGLIRAARQDTNGGEA